MFLELGEEVRDGSPTHEFVLGSTLLTSVFNVAERRVLASGQYSMFSSSGRTTD